jgi:hypothetical protein
MLQKNSVWVFCFVFLHCDCPKLLEEFVRFVIRCNQLLQNDCKAFDGLVVRIFEVIVQKSRIDDLDQFVLQITSFENQQFFESGDSREAVRQGSVVREFQRKFEPPIGYLLIVFGAPVEVVLKFGPDFDDRLLINLLEIGVRHLFHQPNVALRKGVDQTLQIAFRNISLQLCIYLDYRNENMNGNQGAGRERFLCIGNKSFRKKEGSIIIRKFGYSLGGVCQRRGRQIEWIAGV